MEKCSCDAHREKGQQIIPATTNGSDGPGAHRALRGMDKWHQDGHTTPGWTYCCRTGMTVLMGKSFLVEALLPPPRQGEFSPPPALSALVLL